jgi:hypothetical protein
MEQLKIAMKIFHDVEAMILDIIQTSSAKEFFNSKFKIVADNVFGGWEPRRP